MIVKNKNLRQQAFTHKSWINEHREEKSNERLEFLGDAILEFVVSEALYQKFPQENEGFLTALRANLVNTKNLSFLGTKLKIGQNLRLSKGESDADGRKNPSLIANTVEAIIGAIYLDEGLAKARKFIEKNLLTDLVQKAKEPLKDAKSQFQELTQAKGQPAPKYKVLKTTGPDHQKLFFIGVFVNKRLLAKGQGKSKIEAELQAATKALAKSEE